MPTRHRDDTQFWNAFNNTCFTVDEFVRSPLYDVAVIVATTETRPRSRKMALAYLNDRLLPFAYCLHEALDNYPDKTSEVYALLLYLYGLVTMHHVVLLRWVAGDRWPL